MSTISSKTKICMVVGNPIDHSLSPQIHNAGYETLGISDQFVYVAANVAAEHLSDFVKGVRAMGIRGVSCTIPHKTEIIKLLDEIDLTAKTIGAVNTIVNDNGILKGYNTDFLGAIKPLEKITEIKGKTVAVLGAGGAARAVCYGIVKQGGKLLIFNRTPENAEKLIAEFSGKAYSFSDIKSVSDVDVIINTTSIGLNSDDSPLDKNLISNRHIVFDIVYHPFETRLLKDAKEQNATIIHGTEMLLEQACAQFRLFTGKDAPEEEMRKTLMKFIEAP